MGGVFPFMESGELRDRADVVLMADVPLTCFEGGSNFAGPGGAVFDATAHVTLRAREHLVDGLGQVLPNRRLTIPDRGAYTVDHVVTHQFMGYLEVGLVRSQPI